MVRAKAARVLAVFFVSAGCGSELPEPRTVTQRDGAYENVPYPPPAAFTEQIPPAPDERAVWLDGYWTWRGTRYLWRRGGWVLPPPGARYAPWKFEYLADGTMRFAPAEWRDAQGRPLEEPEFLREALTPPNEVTAEELHPAR